MRNVLTAGIVSIACVFLGSAARAADFYDSYYSADDSGGENLTGSPSDLSVLPGPSACDDCGGSSDYECFDGCDSFNDRRRICGLLPSDHCFDSFVSPLTNPFYFEDPRSLTEVRGIFIDNSLPGFLDGGDAQVFAAQLRGRVTDRVSIIATRLGHLQINQSGGDTPNGLMSVPIGFKVNFIRDVERQLLVTGGITYFIKGSGVAGSNFGDGDFNFFLTAGKEIFDYGHWLSGMGFRIPANANFGTQMWYWSNQWDYELFDHIYPLVGVNWFHWMRSAGLDIGAPVTGLDLINLPVSGVAGKNVVSGVIGVKYKPSSQLEFGTGFEFPLTQRTDILRNRLYVDMIFRY